ncbi:MAG: flagellar filament capping protein FliD [Leptospirales bacterium]
MSGLPGTLGAMPGDHASSRMKISNMAALSQNLDTDALVEASVKSASIPLVQLEESQARLESNQAIWAGLEKHLEAFRDASSALHLEGNFNAFKPVLPSHSGFTVSAGNDSAIGHHDIVVESLARPGVAVSSGLPDANKSSVLNIPPDGAFSHGIITFLIGDRLVGGEYKAVRIDQDSGFTLNDLAHAINHARIGVHAMVMKTGSPDAPYSLSLSSTKNGLNFSVVGTEGLGLSFRTVQKASLAHLKVDSVPVLSDSNDVKDAVPGTVIHLRRPTGTVPVPLSIIHDRKKITVNLSKFVKSYNSLVAYMEKFSSFDKMTGRGGPLLGSFTVTEIRNRIGTALTRASGGEGDRFRTLADVGLNFEKNGRLSYDSHKFDQALSSNYQGVVDLLAGTRSHAGLIAGINKITNEMTNPANGPIFGEQQALSSQGQMNQKEIERKQEEIANLRDRMEEKYSSLQGILGGLNAKQNYLSQQIARGTL